MRATVFLGIGLIVLGGGAASAHHSLANVWRDKTVTVTGVVKDFAWGNPHVWIEVLADGSDGMVTQWNIEGSSPTVLARSGWRPSALKPGDKISLGVHPRKDGIAGGYLADAEPLTVNGHTLVSGLHHDPADPE
jgi:hypothetical protein